MKTLYFDCSMGAAGDMLTAALLDMIDEKEKMLKCLNSFGLPGVKYSLEPGELMGSKIHVHINGEEEWTEDVSMKTNQAIAVETHSDQGLYHGEGHHHDHEHHHGEGHHHDHEHHHRHEHHSLKDVMQIVESLSLKEEIKKDIIQVFRLIAEAEGYVHHKSMEQIHFHEVGTMDAIADVAAVCFLMKEIQPDMVIASPIHVGSGRVKCAHGILPVPAPATAYLLREIPIYGGTVEGELCTPTGAALLKYFVKEYKNMPAMKISRSGYGLGKKKFEILNCVTAYLGETEEEQERVLELCCNLDDMTAEEIGFAQEILIEEGALEVYTTAVGMKKSRPGTLLTCLCQKGQEEKMVDLLFKYTTTLGVREMEAKRYVLDREQVAKETKYGVIRVKKASGRGASKEKIEYEDLKKIAKENHISLWEAKNVIKSIQ